MPSTGWPPVGHPTKINPSIKQALSLMAYQLGVSGELQFKKMLGCLEQDDTQCAARAALNSKWAHQTPGRADTVAALFLKER